MVIDKIKQVFPNKDLGILINCAVFFLVYYSLKSSLKLDANLLSKLLMGKMSNTLIT